MSEPSRRELAQLLIPVLRWSPSGGFADSRPLIEQSLALGVGGFQLVGLQLRISQYGGIRPTHGLKCEIRYDHDAQ